MEEPSRFLHSLPSHKEKSLAKGSMMKQAVMTAPGTISFAEVPMPDIKPDEALVRMIRIWVCGSDIHVFHGKHPYTSYPVVQGHEVSGVIEKVLIGTLMYQERDYKKAVELITEGKVNLSPLITNHFPFEQYLESYRFIDEKRDQTMKVIIDVQQEG